MCADEKLKHRVKLCRIVRFIRVGVLRIFVRLIFFFAPLFFFVRHSARVQFMYFTPHTIKYLHYIDFALSMLHEYARGFLLDSLLYFQAK